MNKKPKNTDYSHIEDDAVIALWIEEDEMNADLSVDPDTGLVEDYDCDGDDFGQY